MSDLRIFYKNNFFVVLQIVCLICVFAAKAEARNYNYILEHVEETPRKSENTITSLVKYLTKPLDSDYEKAMAIAFWIAGHINYDTYLYNNDKPTKLIKKYEEQSARELLKSRVGICGDFSELFMRMCEKAGIEVYEISGYVYPEGIKAAQKKNYGPVWNAFVYDNRVVYVDTTFMSHGRTELAGRANRIGRRKALKKIRRANKYESHMTPFNDFYFDFSYADELRNGYVRQERK